MKELVNRIYRIFVKWSRFKKYTSIYQEELPALLKPNTIYLIGEKDNLWQAAFICPCGCDSTIQLSLLKDSRPKWRVSFDDNSITLYPSIHRTTGCKSHFFVTKGKIQWVKSKWYSKKS